MNKIITGQDARVGEWVASRTGGKFSPVLATTIGLERNGELISGVIIDTWNGASCVIHVAAEKGWYSKEYLWFIYHYIFEQMKAKKVIGAVSTGNKAPFHFGKQGGFKLEATLKDACIDGDMLLYTMTKEDCRWLHIKDKHGKIIATTAT